MDRTSAAVKHEMTSIHNAHVIEIDKWVGEEWDLRLSTYTGTCNLNALMDFTWLELPCISNFSFNIFLSFSISCLYGEKISYISTVKVNYKLFS